MACSGEVILANLTFSGYEEYAYLIFSLRVTLAFYLASYLLVKAGAQLPLRLLQRIYSSIVYLPSSEDLEKLLGLTSLILQ